MCEVNKVNLAKLLQAMCEVNKVNLAKLSKTMCKHPSLTGVYKIATGYVRGQQS
jgi:hypothetical protein